MDINLWNPVEAGLGVMLLVSFLLGIVHGITPDEHTWPITFSYSVGAYSTKGGAKAGLLFSLGFTIQRAILSELAFLALASFFMTRIVMSVTYVMVGVAMAGAGLYFSKRGKYFHWHFIEEHLGTMAHIHRKGSAIHANELQHRSSPVESMDGVRDSRPIPPGLALLHGLIAGFGFGAFALILYTVIAPAMPNIYVAFLPGALFGLGTMTMQVIFGALFGSSMRRAKGLSERGVSYVSRRISTSVLSYGGIAFMSAGFLTLIFPFLWSYSLITGIKVHNLHSLGIGFFLVIISVGVIGLISYVEAVKKARQLGYTRAAERITPTRIEG